MAREFFGVSLYSNTSSPTPLLKPKWLFVVKITPRNKLSSRKILPMLRPLQKGLFLPPALLRIRKCSFIIEYAAFAAELKNKQAVFCTRPQVMQNSQCYQCIS